MKLEDLKILIASALEITEENILDKSTKISSLYNKVTEMYITQKKTLNRLNNELEVIYANQYWKIKKEGYNGLDVGKTRNEIETFIVLDKEYSDKRNERNNYENLIKYLEMTLDNLKRVSFEIKNYIELKKIKLGLI